jgi:hypothetical protein
MNTTIKVIMWDRPLKDKTFPLYLRIIHNRKYAIIPINVSVLFDDWDPEPQIVKSSCKLYDDIRHLNSYIFKKRTELNTFVNNL